MAAKKSIVVYQIRNPKYLSDHDDYSPETKEPKHLYLVNKATNTLEVTIGQSLTPDRVNKLIENGIDVTITEEK
jgi:hypothetical protein